MIHYRLLFITALSMMSLQYMTISAMTIREQISIAIDKRKANIVQSLLLLKSDHENIYIADYFNEDTLLHKACKIYHDLSRNDAGDIKCIIKILISNGYYVNAQNKYGYTPFHYVTTGKYHLEKDIIESFFEKHANPNLQNNIGFTPFHYMCQQSDFELITLFLENGSDPNIQTKDLNTPFHFVCHNIVEKNFTINMIKQFFQRTDPIFEKAKPNIQNSEKNTPYHHVTNGIYHHKFIKLFLENGADETIANDDKETPYNLGVKNAGEYREKFRAIRSAKGRNWRPVKKCQNWQEYQCQDEKKHKKYFPNFIKKIIVHDTF